MKAVNEMYVDSNTKLQGGGKDENARSKTKGRKDPITNQTHLILAVQFLNVYSRKERTFNESYNLIEFIHEEILVRDLGNDGEERRFACAAFLVIAFEASTVDEAKTWGGVALDGE